MNNICILDFETTGLNPEIDEIIEYALKVYNQDILIESLVKPNLIDVSERITEITGIKPDDVEQKGITQLDACNNINEFIENNNIKYILAHNGDRFDYLFLKNLYARNYKILPNIKYIDTINIFKNILTVQSYSQKNLCKYYNVTQENAHRAIGDVIDLENICKLAMLNINHIDNEHHDVRNLNDLHNILNAILIFKDSTELQYNILNLSSKDRRLIHMYIEQFNKKYNLNYKHITSVDKTILKIIK